MPPNFSEKTLPRRTVGRFAPSPTGPLHLGSLVTAMASYLDVLTSPAPEKKWLLRIEDIDTPRCDPSTAGQMLRDLTDLGFQWDGPASFQTDRHAHYDDAIKSLDKLGVLFQCTCSRTDQTGDIYNGRCRHSQKKPPPYATRVIAKGNIQWHDRSGLSRNENLQSTCGDFVLKRKDGLWAYMLAVVVDDALQGVTDVVRGKDLVDSTSRQIYLQRLLEYRTPSYWHVPLVLNSEGEKLSKQTGALALDLKQPVKTLCDAWAYLSPTQLDVESVGDFWHQAARLFVRP
jgi:glutamyl-Q tRNA(Asp) synthetase